MLQFLINISVVQSRMETVEISLNREASECCCFRSIITQLEILSVFLFTVLWWSFILLVNKRILTNKKFIHCCCLKTNHISYVAVQCRAHWEAGMVIFVPGGGCHFGKWVDWKTNTDIGYHEYRYFGRYWCHWQMDPNTVADRDIMADTISP